VNTQWDPISFTVKVKITYEEILIYICWPEDDRLRSKHVTVT